MSSYASFAAILALIANVAFLSLSSQYLFHHLDPSPLSRQQTIRFNLNIACLLICCVRACTTSPGSQRQLSKDRLKRWSTAHADATARFCRKCDNWKPERWHHCKTCGTCIPKMDHHCVWLKNCISHRTFPHFIRFLFFSVAAMLYLQYFLYIRFKVLWDHRNLPHVRCLPCSLSLIPMSDLPSQYLGPSALQLVHLLLLGVINSITLFGLSLLFLRSLYGMIINVYTIESWEIERHEALANRARKSGGFVYGPGGVQVWIRKQEYPFDIGLWSNLIQGFGSRNLMAWFWPLAVTPSIDSALEWERNGFEGSFDPGQTSPVLMQTRPFASLATSGPGQDVASCGPNQHPRNVSHSRLH